MSDNSNPLPSKKPSSLGRKLIGYLCLAPIFLGALPVFAIKFHSQFVPSPEWTRMVSTFGMVFGIIYAGLGFWVIFRSVYHPQAVPSATAQTKLEPGSFKAIAVLCFTPLMGYFLGSAAVNLGLPMVLSYTNGGETEIRFEVTEAKKSFDRKCYSPIKVAELPVFFNEICGFPEEFQQSLQTGSWIIVQGQGSKWGVFPKSARIAE